MWKYTRNNTILNVLLILSCSLFKTLTHICLTWYLLVKPEKPLFCLWGCNYCRLALCAFVCIHFHTCIVCLSCMHNSLLVRPVDQQQRQLAVKFYSKWYCAKSVVNVFRKRFRLASDRYIVCESVNIKLCQCQVTISNVFFEETNEQHIFSKGFYN